jgi:hypothetical protein
MLNLELHLCIDNSKTYSYQTQEARLDLTLPPYQKQQQRQKNFLTPHNSHQP